MGGLAAPPPHLCVRKATRKAKGAMHPQPKGWHWHFPRGLQVSKKGPNKLKQTTREKLWKHESIKENQRLKWLKKHQHAQRKTTSSCVNQSRTGLPTNSTSSSTVAPLETEVHNLSSRWCLAPFVAVAFVKGSPLLQSAILREKPTLSWGHYVIPFWVNMKNRLPNSKVERPTKLILVQRPGFGRSLPRLPCPFMPHHKPDLCLFVVVRDRHGLLCPMTCQSEIPPKHLLALNEKFRFCSFCLAVLGQCLQWTTLWATYFGTSAEFL